MNQQQYRLMQIIQKIEVFKGLEVEEARFLLQLFHPQSFEPKQQVYTAGEPSTDMLILLQGKLSVTSSSGDALGEIFPGASIGEMGMFTGHPRSANVIAPDKAAGVVITQKALNAFLKSDPAIRSKILQNIVDLLSTRLTEADHKIEILSHRVQQLEGESEGA